MLTNFIGFQIGWFACVLGAAHGYPLLGPLLAIPIVGLHLVRHADKPQEILLILSVTLVGSLYDQILMMFGLVSYAPAIWSERWLPIWMITLWILFSTTLNMSLRWLQGRYLLAALFGFIGGPLAYWAGARLGAIQWLSHDSLLLALAAGWAILMPLFMKFSCMSGNDTRLPRGHDDV